MTRDHISGTRARRNEQPPRRKGMVVLLFLLIVIFLGITSFANRWRGELQVERIDVRGLRILTEKELVGLAKVPLGTPLYDVDLLEVRGRLRTNPYVRDAVVAHDLPSAIKITIEERRPVAILAGSEPLTVSAEGYVLPTVNSKEVFDLPVITGVSQGQQIKPGMRIASENFKTAIEILTQSANLDRDLYHLISEINVGSSDPIVYTADQGIPVHFGKERIRTQLVYLLSFWNQYVRPQGSERLKFIDLRFEEEIVVGWNKPIGQEKTL